MKTEKVANLHDKTKYIIHITNLKQALNNGLVLKIFFLIKRLNLIKMLPKTIYWYQYWSSKKSEKWFWKICL